MSLSIRTLFALGLLLVCASSATFAINSVSTCTSQSATGFCTRWQQNGSVSETTSCFPASTEVIVLHDGEELAKKMSEVEVGDKVLASVGNEKIYTPVIGWLHKQKQSSGKYLQITTESSNFFVSAMHNIALQDGSYAFAKDVADQYLYNGQKVVKIEQVVGEGIYAPMTEAGNFYVKVGKNQKTLAHCFANIRNPEFYEPFFFTIWKVWEAVYGQYEGSSIHPAAEWTMKTFDFLVENTK